MALLDVYHAMAHRNMEGLHVALSYIPVSSEIETTCTLTCTKPPHSSFTHQRCIKFVSNFIPSSDSASGSVRGYKAAQALCRGWATSTRILRPHPSKP